jgi:hypothetical protein
MKKHVTMRLKLSCGTISPYLQQPTEQHDAQVSEGAFIPDSGDRFCEEVNSIGELKPLVWYVECQTSAVVGDGHLYCTLTVTQI